MNRLTVVLASLVCVGTLLTWFGSGREAAEPSVTRTPVTPPIGDAAISADQPHRTTSTPAALPDRSARPLPTRSIVAAAARPSYCLQTESPDLAAAADAFLARHPGLGLSSADVALLLRGLADLGRSLEEPFIDFDPDSGLVTAAGRFHGQAIASLINAAQDGNAEAALMYGSYLMDSAYRRSAGLSEHDAQAVLLEGEQWLQRAYRNGQSAAAYRLYGHFLFASVASWRERGRSTIWQQRHSSFLAYNRWQQQHASLGRAMLMQNDYLASPVQSPDGESIPNGDSFPPTEVNRKLQTLVTELPAPDMPAAEIGQREHLLWLARQGQAEQFIIRWEADCQSRQ